MCHTETLSETPQHLKAYTSDIYKVKVFFIYMAWFNNGLKIYIMTHLHTVYDEGEKNSTRSKSIFVLSYY